MSSERAMVMTAWQYGPSSAIVNPDAGGVVAIVLGLAMVGGVEKMYFPKKGREEGTEGHRC